MSLEQPSAVSSSPSTILDAPALVSNSGCCGKVHGGPCGGHEGRLFCSGSRGGGLTVGQGDRKYNHYGGTNIILNPTVDKGMESQVTHIRSL